MDAPTPDIAEPFRRRSLRWVVRWKWWLLYVAFVAASLVLVVPLTRLAYFFSTRAIDVTELRSVGLAIGGLTVLLSAIVGFPFAILRTAAAREQAKAASSQADVSFRNHISDRFGAAVELLGSEQTAARLGGIYALEMIAHSSGEYHWTIIETLAAFVRDKTPREKLNPLTGRSEEVTSGVPVDVQAAITVIGRRSTDHIRNELANNRRIDFGRTNLSDAIFNDGKFGFAFFGDCNLNNTAFWNSALNGAYFGNADLQNATLVGSDLSGSFLQATDFSKAVIRRCDFSKARMPDADFSSAKISKSDFRETERTGTKFPKGFDPDAAEPDNGESADN